MYVMFIHLWIQARTEKVLSCQLPQLSPLSLQKTKASYCIFLVLIIPQTNKITRLRPLSLYVHCVLHKYDVHCTYLHLCNFYKIIEYFLKGWQKSLNERIPCSFVNITVLLINNDKNCFCWPCTLTKEDL